MDANDYKATEYHKAVWKKAKEDTKSYFRLDTWAWIGGGIAALLSGGITTYVQYLWSDVVMVPLWVSIVTIFAGTILGLAGFVIILYGWNGLWNMPAKLYREKEKQALRRTWKDIEIKPINFPDEPWIGVGLSIVSDKPEEFQITNFYPKITRILQGREEIYRCGTPNCGIELSVIERKTESESFYLRTDALHVPNRKKLGGLTVAFHVAYSKNSQALIKGKIEKEGEQPRLYEEETNLPCQVTITLRGLLGSPADMLGHDDMDMCELICEIKKDKEKGLSITMRRNPPYEYK